MNPNRIKQKIYKSTSGKRFTGVCGGIAERYSTKPWIVRSIFILATILTGVAPILYLLLVLVLKKGPKNTNSAEVNNPKPGTFGKILLLTLYGGVTYISFIIWVLGVATGLEHSPVKNDFLLMLILKSMPIIYLIYILVLSCRVVSSKIRFEGVDSTLVLLSPFYLSPFVFFVTAFIIDNG